jgi:hypothetical protein
MAVDVYGRPRDFPHTCAFWGGVQMHAATTNVDTRRAKKALSRLVCWDISIAPPSSHHASPHPVTPIIIIIIIY